MSWLQAANKLPKSRVIVLGDQLFVGYSPARAASRAAARPSARVPRDKVKALIRKEAKRAGVDVHLALAVAYQESLPDERRLGAGAVARCRSCRTPVSGSRARRRAAANRAIPEDNVVVAGVRFLALLMRMTGKREAALAGYYQGLASVRRNGEYADTKAYVRNVLFLQRRFGRG